MIRPQLVLDLNAELIVDNFAGGGGASSGIERALGRCVDIAINHDEEAVAMHEANHPQTRHFIEDVWKVDPVKATGGRPVGLAWFSPDCKHFSKAKGGKPRDKKIRGLCWVVLRWMALVRPRVVILENVEEFKTMGPLLSNGHPCPVRKGRGFLSFMRQIRGHGYVAEVRELRACDYGAPTIRKRLFIIARCDGRPIVWPEPTHGAPDSEGVRSGRLKPWRTAAECIDWSIPCPSIFERKRPLAENTERRIARGIRRYVIQSENPFIVKVNHTSPGYDTFRGQPIDEPLQTITAHHGYGLAAPHLTKFRTGSVGADLNAPMPTITAGPKLDPAGAPHALGLVTPFLTEHANASKQRNNAADEPLRTQCAEVKGGHFAVVAPSLVQTGYGEREGQAPRALDIEKPLGTVVGGGQKHALCSSFLAKHYGGHETPGSSLEKPVDTITATDHNALVTAQIVGAGGPAYAGKPKCAGEPFTTLTSENHRAVVASHLSKLYGTTTGQDNREPMATVTGGGNHIGEVRALLIKYYGEGGQHQDCREPMHTIPTKDRIGLVTVAGEEYVIADIGMRMLEPHELYAAQGFARDYKIKPFVITKARPAGYYLPKHAMVRMCGNSVCPDLAEALAGANVPDLAVWGKGERRAA